MPRLPPGGCDIIDLRITCALRLSIHTYMSHVFVSVRIPRWSALMVLSLESGCCSCCDDVHVMLKSLPLELLRDVLRDGRNRRTDGLRDGTLPASSELSSSHGKREKENSPNTPPLFWGESRNEVFFRRIFASWCNNHNTK